MVMKQYVGKQEFDDFIVQYYMIQQSDFFGVELVKTRQEAIISASEYFTENPEDALLIANRLYKGKVTPLTLEDVIDDCLSGILN